MFSKPVKSQRPSVSQSQQPKVEDVQAIVSSASGDPQSPLNFRMVYGEPDLREQFEDYAASLALIKNSKIITRTQWDTRVKVISGWNTGAYFHGVWYNQSELRKKYKIGYDWLKVMRVESNLSGVFKLIKKASNPKDERIMVHLEEAFDIIKEQHVQKGCHIKADRTWQNLKETYANIPLSLTKKYVELCPICCAKQPRHKPAKGAIKPIESDGYRDRFQLDLIDFRMDPQKWPDDEDGTTYKWLFVVKDHFTKFLVAHELPSKSPVHVARALYKIYSIIGYPLIQHTDNGREFVAKEVTRLLHEMAPNSRTITGRPRTSTDQGSVERSNQTIKVCISSAVHDERKSGVKNASWLTEYPRVISALNSTSNRGEIPAYTIVFTVPFVVPRYNQSVMSDIQDQDSVLERCQMEGRAFEQKMLQLQEVGEEDLRALADLNPDHEHAKHLLAEFEEEHPFGTFILL